MGWRKAGALAAALAWPLTGCGDMCGNLVLQQVAAPDGKHKAVVFTRNCGATTDFSAQVSVIDAGAGAPSGAGNVFGCDSNHGAAPSAQAGGPFVAVKWLDARTLRVIYDHRDRVFQAETCVGDVAVVYAPGSLSGPAAGSGGPKRAP